MTAYVIREVLVADEIQWGARVEVGTWFEGTPWDDPLRFPHRISYARVLHRDIRRHRPVRVVDSWPPAGLASPELLKEYDDEAVVSLLAREGGEKARARAPTRLGRNNVLALAALAIAAVNSFC